MLPIKLFMRNELNGICETIERITTGALSRGMIRYISYRDKIKAMQLFVKHGFTFYFRNTYPE
jgi:hypothetical protein